MRIIRGSPMRFTSRTARLRASSSYSTSSLSRRFAFHIAAALLVFTLVQLWAIATAIEAGAPRWLPLVGLVILMGGAIPLSRILERRWQRWGQGVLPCAKLTKRYRRDRALLWGGAFFVPLLWVLALAYWLTPHAF